jgi:copper chaperone NosL
MFKVEKHAELIVILLVGCSLLAACGKTEPQPLELAPEDMCAFCRMAISEKRFAAELVTDDGDTFKFDDIGCMLDFSKGKQNLQPIAASFVVDFETHEWVRGDAAFYVHSAEFKTPMSHGIVAFKDFSRAEAAAKKYQGRSIRFSELAAR